MCCSYYFRDEICLKADESSPRAANMIHESDSVNILLHHLGQWNFLLRFSSNMQSNYKAISTSSLNLTAFFFTFMAS